MYTGKLLVKKTRERKKKKEREREMSLNKGLRNGETKRREKHH